MDMTHFKKLSKKWCYKFRAEQDEVFQEITLFFLERKAAGKSLDIFDVGNKGALFSLIKYKFNQISDLPSVGGSGSFAKKSSDHDFEDYDSINDLQNESEILSLYLIEITEEKEDQLCKRHEFEIMFSQELDELDELNQLSGVDLASVMGFSGANGRMALSKLKADIVKKTEKKFCKRSKSSNLFVSAVLN